MQHLEFCQQVLWPELDVQLASVTEQWAQYRGRRPARARRAAGKVVDPADDISDEAFPYHGVRRGHRLRRHAGAAVPRLVLRRTGLRDRACRRATASADAARSWRPASAFGIAPYGTEALGVMRIEKGHVAGNEINGQTTAHDLGLGSMVSAKKDFIGRFMAARWAEPQRALFGQVQIINSLCQWIQTASSNDHLDQILALMPDHLRSSSSSFELITRWDAWAQGSVPLNCSRPWAG